MGWKCSLLSWGFEAAAFGVMKLDADERLFAGRAFRHGLVGYVFSCGVVANGVVLELNVMQCEVVWSEGDQTPASSLGFDNLCSYRVFRSLRILLIILRR